MVDQFDPRQFVDPATVRRLMIRSDRDAFIKVTVQLSLFAGLMLLIGTTPLPLGIYVPVLFALGFVVFSLYAPFHETTHGTAFRSDRMNKVVAWITGILYGYSPGMHADFHFTHHRHTNKENDPEKGLSLPPMPGRTILSIFLIGIFGMLPPLHSLVLAFVPAGKWDRFEASWAQASQRKRYRLESAIVAACWIVGIGSMTLFNPGLLLAFLLALWIGRTIHAVVTLSEHEGTAEDGHMLFRTRTMQANPIFRWFWWNMNYHSEHHTWPSVPYHQLPELNRIVEGQIVHNDKGYLRFLFKMSKAKSARLKAPSHQ